MKEAAMEAPEMVTFDGETFQAAGPWLPAPEIAQYVRTEVMDARAARLAEVERELVRWRELRKAIATLCGYSDDWPDHGNAPLAIAAGYALTLKRADAAEARLAEVERERDGWRDAYDKAARQLVKAAGDHAEAEARAERLAAALRHLEARLPVWREAVSDWDAGGETALYEMDEAEEIIAAALQQEGGE
jgi:hypothetical protein